CRWPRGWWRRLNIFGQRFECSGLRACLKIARGAAARDFGRGQGGEAPSIPVPPWPDESRANAVHGQKDPPPGGFSCKRLSGFVAPQSQSLWLGGSESRLAREPFARKQHPLEFSDRL